MAYDSAAPYQPEHPIRLVTAASLFDGHDAAINMIRRLLQSGGAEVIHLGHNRSAQEIVDCAIQEDAQGIAITSYQGGHLEYFKYVHDLLKERGADIKVFGGGGGTILPDEIEELHAYGISRIYSPDDGRALGLGGMIGDVLKQADKPSGQIELDAQTLKGLQARDPLVLGRLISLAENQEDRRDDLDAFLKPLARDQKTPILGITGTGGAGKSSLIDELVQRFLRTYPDKRLGIISVDPSKRKSGGALLGDRIRMNAIGNERVYMRSLATRQANLALSKHVQSALDILDAAAFDLIILETSGIGQSDTEITEHSDLSLYVMTSEYGAATQLEKIDMLDFADLIAINKFDKPGSLDALRDVRKQYRRNHNRFEGADEELPIHGTIASQFNDSGMNRLFGAIMAQLSAKCGASFAPAETAAGQEGKAGLLPAARGRYLAEIAEGNRGEASWIEAQAQVASRLWRLLGAIEALRGRDLPSVAGLTKERLPREDWTPFTTPTAEDGDSPEVQALIASYAEIAKLLDGRARAVLEGWAGLRKAYADDKYRFQVRDKTIELDLVTTSLSGQRIPKVCVPRYADWGEVLRFAFRENVPGAFPYTAGVFPLKREGEDPARMFAGEGGPERTNKRFHYVSEGLPAKRLSTAFDSVTLYGEDPDHRPDIYGKIGNSGVSIATLDDAKKLYSGFDLADPRTSVSMTINGPAPMILSFFMNAAIDQQCERWLAANGKLEEASQQIDAIYAERGLERPRYQGELPKGNDGLGLALLGVTGDEILPADVYKKIAADTVTKVRGTVQADILKEDQAQNTCIFSTEFALRMMGDIQEWFVDHGVRNFYSVSISGYHIAEAGANPITQLALTLANGFTYVEYYLARGMKIDDFAPNLSFFFSNGVDPEYAVIGRVARRIWARAIQGLYGGNERSQKLKYHIQTSGRSLHAQEIAFNDIRTTLQALYAIYDNCNSLHTNAYDEAITTPTEESVRRALAIQLIINKELGLAKNENPLQGSFIIEELTDLVEEAVLLEFERLNSRGGVLGAMERMYQRGKIQDESLHYEAKKHSGELPLIGVNTFLDSKGSPTIVPPEVIRSTETEREYAITSCRAFQKRAGARTESALTELQRTATTGGNIFASLLEVTKVASLGQISRALYEVGGQYRRNM